MLVSFFYMQDMEIQKSIQDRITNSYYKSLPDSMNVVESNDIL